MVEVKLYLYDAHEINMLAQLEAVLAQKRKVEQAVQEPVGATGAPLETLDQRVERAVSELGVDPDRVALNELASEEGLKPFDDTTAAAAVVDDITVQRAVTEYAQRVGVPAAKDLLKEFGASRVMDIPAEQRAAFVARTQTQSTEVTV